MLSIRLTRLAESDLDEVWEYLAVAAGVETADRVLDDCERALRKLARRPGMGHPREDLAPAYVRWWLVHSYAVAYLIDGNELTVLRVLHSSRDVRAVLDTAPPE